VIGLRSFNPASVIPLVEVVATQRPADVRGMHFFNPAAIMQLVEVVSKVATAPDADAIVWRSTLGSVSSRCAAEIGPGSL
jgi:3-hydroxybutyryl-CoA dehydrogenase